MLDEITDNIRSWHEEKGIGSGTPVQPGIDKMLEEIEELQEVVDDPTATVWESRLELGDVYVTLVGIAEKMGIDLEEAANAAYNKIKDRKGELRDGQFVKEADL